ncbi:protein PYRICULARIA ORYZAE RESISTANCE 21-like [Pistacia vera]|uniref:protein PYRICULARIA ORYZAE RESISTANCE 21-like n=1 Tax=Pistacia vera TaxID=55513 RepID=UPI001263C32F|nr:protein PYRICULARIA ORYZAE RESISTANCE 21-like [Pistacia vera]
MGEKKVARMRLKVDLQCEKCYRKVKKVLCKFPQIQDQVYDEKQNTVTIKVVCCSPEKIKQKICCKGGDSIKSIEIIPPPKPKEPKKPEEKKKEPAELPKQRPIEPIQAPPIGKPPTEPPPARAKAEPPKQDKPMVTFVDPPAPGFPPPAYPNPVGMCCRECYEGRGRGPCYQLDYYGRPRCYCGYNGRPVCDSWGTDSYGVNRCDYFSEENPNAACRIM